MNVLKYFRNHFPNYGLTDDAGAGDGCSLADVLEEMPLDSTRGDAGFDAGGNWEQD